MENFSQNILALATLVGSLTAAIMGIGGMIVSLRNSKKIDDKGVKDDARAVVQDQKLETLHSLTNGMSEKLNAAKLAQGDAEGFVRGVESKSDK